jgi:hypothetical protein
MNWIHLLSYFLGGLCLMNAVPHLVNGISGRPFQTPFAKPPGKGLSTSIVNVLWSFLNLVVAYLLICKVGDFALSNVADAVALGLGGLAIALVLATHFGTLHGGRSI